MPPLKGAALDNIEHVTMDDDLVNFLAVADGTYKPLLFQYDEFDMQADPYDSVASDSENELYLIKFGKKKPKAWLRTNHSFDFSWLKWLNSQDGKSYVRARPLARAAAKAFKRSNDEKAAERVAIARFGGPPQEGEFYKWFYSYGEEQEAEADAEPETETDKGIEAEAEGEPEIEEAEPEAKPELENNSLGNNDVDNNYA
ncbi:hypothetical protein BGX38DRAFT_1273711 [Terfezia claveryi]|nr:hypothetical protein BGX38DRAFT_1273711 [Terfezia claveryi]